MDSYSPRQLCALLWASLAAPLVTVCSAVSWPWVLLGAGGAAVVLAVMGIPAARCPEGEGAAALLRLAWGNRAARLAGCASWLWLALAAALAASMAVTAFPRDNAFPAIPLVLLALGTLPAAKGPAAACRFGATLFLAVAPMIALVLVFGAADVRLAHLSPGGAAGDAAAPMAVLLLPAAGFFLRDRLGGRGTPWIRWFLLAGLLAAAVSVVCVGALGGTLAKTASNAFWYMSQSISVFGVMERFEAVISALLAISFCCLLAFLVSAGQKALCCAAPAAGEGVAAWGTAALAAVLLRVVPLLPDWVWFVGNLLFWGLLPAVTLWVVEMKNSEKNRKKC